MREIKFRAWFRDEHSSKAEMHYDVRDFKDNPDQYHYYRVMQYTGLKDKNGKEIYDSDLLGYYYKGMNSKMYLTKRPTVVKWKGSGFNIRERACDNYEVVGNIYENPELLK